MKTKNSELVISIRTWRDAEILRGSNETQFFLLSTIKRNIGKVPWTYIVGTLHTMYVGNKRYLPEYTYYYVLGFYF